MSPRPDVPEHRVLEGARLLGVYGTPPISYIRIGKLEVELRPQSLALVFLFPNKRNFLS